MKKYDEDGTVKFDTRADRLLELARDLAAYENITEKEALRRLRDMLTGQRKPVRVVMDQDGISHELA